MSDAHAVITISERRGRLYITKMTSIVWGSLGAPALLSEAVVAHFAAAAAGGVCCEHAYTRGQELSENCKPQ